MKELKHYFASVLIRTGEHETYSDYCFSAPNMESAKKEVNEGYDIGGDDFERVAEVYRLDEVSEAEYNVLRKYI
tara:strand:- start:1629 stop:1850 length:222 start_codon:yes stop_codon:yes gene_type:complete